MFSLDDDDGDEPVAGVAAAAARILYRAFVGKLFIMAKMTLGLSARQLNSKISGVYRFKAWDKETATACKLKELRLNRLNTRARECER